MGDDWDVLMVPIGVVTVTTPSPSPPLRSVRPSVRHITECERKNERDRENERESDFVFSVFSLSPYLPSSTLSPNY